jgi:hypothetical protein
VGGENDGDMAIHRDRLEPLYGRRELFIPWPRARRERLQRIDDDELHIVRIRDAVGDDLGGARRWRPLDPECVVPETHGCRTDVCARALVEISAPEVIDPRPAFDRERPLEHALGFHLRREKERAPPGFRHAQGDRQRERRLSGPRVASDDGQVAATETAAEQLVETRESRRDSVGRRSTIGDGIHPFHEAGEGRDVGAAWHGGKIGRVVRREQAVWRRDARRRASPPRASTRVSACRVP